MLLINRKKFCVEIFFRNNLHSYVKWKNSLFTQTCTHTPENIRGYVWILLLHGMFLLFLFTIYSYLDHAVHRTCIKRNCTGSFKLLVRKICWESENNWFEKCFSNYILTKMILSILNLVQEISGAFVAVFICWTALKHIKGKANTTCTF